jgi:capsular exopolysaccharide synthesis family protein
MNNHSVEPAAREEIDLEQYVLLLRAHLWLLVIAAILAATIAFIGSQFVTPIYQASTTVLIDEAPSTDIADYNALLTSERRARTYAQLLTEQPVLEATIERLGLTMDLETLSAAVEARRVPDTQLIQILAEHTDPALAADIANTIVAVFTEQTEAIQTSRYEDTKASLLNQLADLERQIEETNTAITALGDSPEDKAEQVRLEALQAQYRQSYTNLLQSYEEVRVAEARAASTVIPVKVATPPDKPARPNTLLNTALAGGMGLLVAVTGVFIKDLLDDTLKSPDDVARLLDLPVLGLIAHIDVGAEEELLISATDPRSPIAEAFRSLRTNIQYAGVDRPIKTLLITSPSPEDGKSTVASNLGVVIAQNARQVVLMEGDLRHPAVHKRMGLPNESGLSALFVGALEQLDSVMQRSHIPGLAVLSSGGIPPNPSELLDSERTRRILDYINERAEMVLIDAPPVMAVADAVVLAPHVDGVLLVARVGKTKIPAIKQAVEQLRRVGGNLIGVVMTSVDAKGARYSRYYHYYYSHYGHYRSKEEGKSGTKEGNGSLADKLGIPLGGASQGARKSGPARGGTSYGTVRASDLPAHASGHAARNPGASQAHHRSQTRSGKPSAKGMWMAILGGCVAITGVVVAILGAGRFIGCTGLGLGVGIMGIGLFIAGIGRSIGRSALSAGLIVAGMGAVGVGAIYATTGAIYVKNGGVATGWGLVLVGAWLLVVGLGTVAFGARRIPRASR